MTSICPSPRNRMDDIILKPHLSCGIRWQDKKTGICGKEKSFHFSTTTTLWQMMLVFLGLCLAAKGVMWFCRMRMQSQIKKKFRKKMGKRKLKMAKS